MVMRGRVFLIFWVNAGFFEFALPGSKRLFSQLAAWFVKKQKVFDGEGDGEGCFGGVTGGMANLSCTSS